MSSLTLGWQNLFALLGALQGTMLASVLGTKPTNRTANRLLAATLVAFSVHLATAAYHGAGLVDAAPHLFGIGYPMGFLFGPLVYLYAVSASERSRRLAWRDALHLLPFLATVVMSVPIYALNGSEKEAMYHAMTRGSFPWQVTFTSSLKLVSGVGYSIATVRFLRKHRASMAENYSSLERVNLRWVQWLVISAAFIWALATAFDLAEPLGIVPPSLADPVITVLMTLVVYGIGYMGLRQPEIFHFTAEHRVPAEAAPPEPVDAAPARYERSGLTERQAATLKRRLLECMEQESPYRNADLTLADLAGRLDTTPHKLSEVLNSQVRLSFFEFVNGYRVREVQRRLLTTDGASLTFLTLALDAGFASKSTFNAVFKKHTGLTPSAFRSQPDTARVL